MNLFLAVAPVVLLLLGFSVYCLRELVRRDAAMMPKWAWVIVIVLSQPAGGIAYLALGRRERQGH